MTIREDDFVKFNLDTNNINNIILFVTIKKEYPTDIEWKNINRLITDFYKSAELKNYKFSIIFDLRKLGKLELKKYEEWRKLFTSLKNKTSKFINKTCLIVDNNILKMSINMFLLLYKSVRPLKVVQNFQQSLQFINNLN